MAFATLIVDCNQIKRNIQQLNECLSPTTKRLLVAKANAYGLGAVPICKTLDNIIDYIGVANTTEAVELRSNGIKSPILLLTEPKEKEFPIISSQDISVTLYKKSTIQHLEDYANKTNTPIRTHLKIDTGMTRLGAHWKNCQDIISAWTTTSPKIVKEGIYSHFANSETNHQLNETQLQRFINETKQQHNKLKHLSNSGGIRNQLNAEFDLVRIGIGAYENSFTLHAPIQYIQSVPKNTAIGYGSTYITDSSCQIAIIGIGYADGIATCYAENNGHVHINNQAYPIIGKICMDMIMVKIPQDHHISSNDSAILISPEHAIGTSLNEMAEITNQNPREIMTRFSHRITRQYIGN